MKAGWLFATVGIALASQLTSAQSSTPVAAAFARNSMDLLERVALIAESMPADKYTFRPAPLEYSFAELVNSVALGNVQVCAGISKSPSPAIRIANVSEGKDSLATSLRETVRFCGVALGSVDDSRLDDSVTVVNWRSEGGARRLNRTRAFALHGHDRVLDGRASPNAAGFACSWPGRA